MAISDDMNLPRLTPMDDRYTTPGSLFRTPLDITVEQFDLLAAAWAEGALEGDSLDEFELILSSSADKRTYAESFRNLRLIAVNDRWDGIKKALHKSPVAGKVRHIFYAAAAAAAVIVALLTIQPFAEKHGETQTTVSLQEPAIVPQQANPGNDFKISEQAMPLAKIEPFSADPEETTHELNASPSTAIEKVTGLTIPSSPEILVIAAATGSNKLIPVKYNEIIPPAATVEEENWIVRGIARLSGAAGKDGGRVDGFAIAGACVNAVNAFFGWDMVLDRVVSKNGDHTTVNFSSSLLSFSAPAKKSMQ